MEKLGQNCAQLFLLNKYTVFTIVGTVAPQFPIPTFYNGRATDLQPVERGVTEKKIERREKVLYLRFFILTHEKRDWLFISEM